MSYKKKTDNHVIKELGNLRTRITELEKSAKERKQIEKELHESEEIFKTIMASAKDAIIMIDHEGNISYWNKTAEKIFGYSSHEAIGKECHIFLGSKRYHKDYRKGFRRFKKTGIGPVIGKTLELEALRSSGEEFPIELSLSSFKHKKQWHALGIVRDISERKVAEKERLQKEKLMGVLEMAGAASHELNQPLQIVSGYAELLSESIIEDHPFNEPIKTIKKQCERLGDLTNKIMRITKYETVEYINGMKIIDIHKASKKK